MLHLNLNRIAEIPGQKDSLKPECTCKLDKIIDRGSLVLKEGAGVQIADQTRYHCSNSHCKSDGGAHMVSKEYTRVQKVSHNRYYHSASRFKSEEGACMVLIGGTLVQNMGNHCFLCKYNHKLTANVSIVCTHVLGRVIRGQGLPPRREEVANKPILGWVFYTCKFYFICIYAFVT